MTMKFDPRQYEITVRRSENSEDGAFEAVVREFPDVVVFADDPTEAYHEALSVIEGLHELSAELGHPFPSPAPRQTQFSGRITLRMQKSLHAAAVQYAEYEGVSLNTFVSDAVVGVIGALRGSGHQRIGGLTSFPVIKPTGWLMNVGFAETGAEFPGLVTHLIDQKRALNG